MVTAQPSKQALRQRVRERLRALGPLARSMEEELVAARVQASPEWARAGTVALYRAVPPELSVVALGNAAWRDGKRTVYPRVAGDHLVWHEVRAWSQLSPGAFGIPEPDAGLPVVGPHDVDLWIVPGVAFTTDGGRVGQGGGFYDRVLGQRRTDAHVWGVCFEVQLEPSLPLEAHDLSMDRVVTADGST